MVSATVSVIIAAAQSVAKVFVIGIVGYVAVLRPKKSPLLPRKSVNVVARYTFHVLLLPLIYSTTARSVSPETIGNYWFVIVAGWLVIAVSFLTATALGYLFCIQNPADFSALRVAASFPNIVALPILIFPSLCEYEVVYKSYNESQEECIAMSTTMIFCYFFAWSLAFWAIGYPMLRHAAEMKKEECESSTQTLPSSSLGLQEERETDQRTEMKSRCKSIGTSILHALKQTFTSPGFIALLLGFITGCIAPLQAALFEAGGALRFLGSALETMGQASSPLSTLVVAASLVPTVDNDQQKEDHRDEENNNSSQDESQKEMEGATEATLVAHEPSQDAAPNRELRQHGEVPDQDNPIMSDPNFGPYRRRRSTILQPRLQSLRRSSVRLMKQTAALTRTTPEMRRLLSWFVASRLIVAPAIVIAIVAGLDCSKVLTQVPDLAKLVVIVNASVPGALIVIVLLKARPELADTATVVARVYLPSYLLSIVTIAAWTALGLWITLPDENGNTICEKH